MKKIVGTVITLVIGGTVYTVSQADIARNFSKDTGLSQQESEQYVENIAEDDLASFEEVGSEFILDGEDFLSAASEIDCYNYEYEWETNTLSCEEGKIQLRKIGNSEIALGKAFVTLDSESATTDDISSTIRLIDRLNIDLNLEIVSQLLDYPTIDEVRKTNSYNKALLQAALESD